MKKDVRDWFRKNSRKAGKASAAALTPAERRERGRRAVRSRWKYPTVRQRRAMRRDMSARLRRKYARSAYAHPCATCGAKPFEWCRTLRDDRSRLHMERKAGKASASVPLPPAGKATRHG